MHGGPQNAFKVGLIKCINNWSPKIIYWWWDECEERY